MTIPHFKYCSDDTGGNELRKETIKNSEPPHRHASAFANYVDVEEEFHFNNDSALLSSWYRRSELLSLIYTGKTKIAANFVSRN